MPSIQVRNVSDIALARNFLRKRITGPKWSPKFRARAVATMTTLAESILNAQPSGILEVSVLTRQGKTGVALGCDLKIAAGDQKLIEQTKNRLARVADDLDTSTAGGSLHIVAYLWASKENGHA